MFSKLRNFIMKTNEAEIANVTIDTDYQQLAQAALMFHVIAADGIIHKEEKNKMCQVLQTKYGLSQKNSIQLIEEAKRADSEAIDLYSFTSILKRQLDENQRLGLIENLWEMVFADGEIHELEDNVVWRIAELLGVDKRDRMQIKQSVRRKIQTE